jgi:hypothetical protein
VTDAPVEALRRAADAARAAGDHETAIACSTEAMALLPASAPPELAYALGASRERSASLWGDYAVEGEG